MKHIFKKLHKGGNHEANRSNEASTAASTSGVSNNRHDSSENGSSHTPAIPSSLPSPAAFSANVTSSGGAVVSTPGTTRSDYISSEEEFQMQLALAISASSSNSDLRDDQEREQIRAATLISLGENRIDALRDVHGSAEALSKQYWAYNVLDYEEKVVDGFYDVFKISTGPGDKDEMPSLANLEANFGKSNFEVVMVNRTIDSLLEELMQIAHCMALDCSLLDVGVLVQRLAELVTEHMGGPVTDANVTMAKWVEKRLELRASLHTSVFPIGSISVGLSRHRALLFKVLADAAGIPCRLVKGSHYTGVDDDAVNIIKLDNERECLVDLMAAPGTLIPSDVLSIKDTAYKPYHPEGSSIQSISLLNDTGVSLSKQKPLRGGQGSGSQQSAASDNLAVNVNSHSELLNIFSNATRNHGADFSGVSSREVIFDRPDPSVAATNLYGHKGNVHRSANGSVQNQNVVPYDHCDADNSINLFADLNPFQVKTSNKIYTLNKVGTLSKDNNITSPQLAWSHHACKDVPLNNDKEIFGRMLPSEKDHNLPSLATNITLESGNAHVFNKSNNLKSTATEHPDGSCVSRADFTPEVGQCSTSVIEENMSCNNDEYKKNDGFLDTQIEETRDNGNITSITQNTSYDQYGVANFENTGIGGLRSSDVTSTSKVDHMLDDVGDCEIPWEDFVIGERIGLGSYGEVYRADWNGTEVAVKKFLDQDFSGAALAEFKREVRIMQRLRHPNIVLFMGAVTRPPNLSIVTEFIPRGSLYRILHRPQCQISEKRRLRMALDVAKGMNCLHSSIPTIVHRDLKSPNLLVDNNWNVKVGDFGLSRLKHNTFLSSKSTAGTPEWMAPEVLRNEPSNEKCDVYSFGVILWELATLKLPWSGMNPMQVVGAVGFQNRHLEIPKDVDHLVSHVISECWQLDPNKRPSFAQLTVLLKPLQYLIIPSHVDQQSSTTPESRIPVSSTPL